MELIEDVIKKRFNDSSFEYRAHCFREFLKSPVRTFKESPTIKDYVPLDEDDLNNLLLDYEEYAELPDNNVEADILFVNDHIESVSENLKGRGVKVQDLLSVASETSHPLREYIYAYFGLDREEFLINATWKNGYLIYIPDGVSNLEISVVVLTDSSNPSVLKNLIVVGNDSNCVIKDKYVNYSAGKSVHGKTVYMHIGKRSHLSYHYIQEKNADVTDLTFVKSFLEEFSEFTFYHVNRGGSRVIFSNLSYMKGEGSNFKTFGVSYSDNDQRFDIRDSSFQTGKACNADIQVRGVVKGKSLTIHRGNIDIEEMSVKSTGFYDSRILLLSKDGYANSKPGLIIRNNDTKSKHASAISSLDKEQIFYLRSRGIPEKLAKSLMTEGFLLANLEKSNDLEMEEKVHRYSEEILREPDS